MLYASWFWTNQWSCCDWNSTLIEFDHAPYSLHLSLFSQCQTQGQPFGLPLRLSFQFLKFFRSFLFPLSWSMFLGSSMLSITVFSQPQIHLSGLSVPPGNLSLFHRSLQWPCMSHDLVFQTFSEAFLIYEKKMHTKMSPVCTSCLSGWWSQTFKEGISR